MEGDGRSCSFPVHLEAQPAPPLPSRPECGLQAPPLSTERGWKAERLATPAAAGLCLPLPAVPREEG